jgi:hypothetical protein
MNGNYRGWELAHSDSDINITHPGTIASAAAYDAGMASM